MTNDEQLKSQLTQVLTCLKFQKIKTERTLGVLRDSIKKLYEVKQEQDELDKLITDWLGEKR